jgi:Ankyrin repeats (3 copies)/Ankyrin repeats (many copies)
VVERAKTGNSAQAVRSYLEAGGAPTTLVQGTKQSLQLPLLLCIACANAHPHRELAESVRLLVGAGADINAKAAAEPDGDEHTALMFAAGRSSGCCTAVLDILLGPGDPCVQSTGRCLTALHIAAEAGSVGCCDLLIRRADIRIDARAANGWTALMHTAFNGRADNVQLLLQHGADVNAPALDNLTPLITASSRKHVHVVAVLLKAGADVNAAYKQGLPALTAAVQSESVTVVRLLLDNGADISVKDSSGQNILFQAARIGQVAMLELLVRHGSTVYAADSNGHTLLMIAAAKGHKAAAEWLLQQGVAADAVDSLGFTALHHVVMCSSSDEAAIVELLLVNGADVHKCTEHN